MFANRFSPAYPGYFADPFVWKFRETYYAIGTGEAEACGGVGETVFPMLRSDDFREWRLLGRVLRRPADELGFNYWAPEVAYRGGLFHMYYSVGHGDRGHQLRVALAAKPDGPYEDIGKPLLDPAECPFAIDPHPFRDLDGSWHLFYARDFLDEAAPYRVGTGLMVAPMRTMLELRDPGVMVLRPTSDWQRFQKNRPMYGANRDWHTLEGPCVVLRNGHYYCLFSGGRWEDDTYGVDYAVAGNVLGPYDNTGGEAGPRLLRTVPGELIGPGHNSVVEGPEGVAHIAFHAWDAARTARRMFINPLSWQDNEPRTL